ncbi:MAG TPA: pitrilysin family protein [Bryobacteraceae bacterium]|nr:pitrilysin family protein [Bryobacteraceae bacterium]
MIAKLALIACCTLAAFGAPAPQKVFPYHYAQEDLPNGLRLITVPTDYPNIVATYIVVQTGSRNEVERGHTGFAHLFEHLMFRGTQRFPSTKYDETMRRIGASTNAFTTEDFTCFHTTFSKEDLPTVLDMEADRFRNLKYTEAEFKTEALAVLGEYNKNSSNPFRKLDEVVFDTAFDRHTYKHSVMGFLPDVQAMPNSYDYSLKFFDHYYRPEFTTIIVVGDVKAKDVRKLVDRYWGSWKRGTFKPDIPQEPAQQAPRANHVAWTSPTLPIMTVAYKVPAYTDSNEDSVALDAVASLAFSRNSDLYRKLVIEEQKVDELGADHTDHVDPSLFEITARVKDPADIDYVRDQILATVKSFREKPVDAARLDALRKHQRYAFELQMDDSGAIAEVVAAYVALRRSPETINKIYDRYAELTPQAVQRAAAKYLVEDGRTIVTLTGPEDAK